MNYAITHIRVSTKNAARGLVSIKPLDGSRSRFTLFVPAGELPLFGVGGELLGAELAPAVVGKNADGSPVLSAERSYEGRDKLTYTDRAMYLTGLAGYNPPKTGGLSAAVKAILAP